MVKILSQSCVTGQKNFYQAGRNENSARDRVHTSSYADGTAFGRQWRPAVGMVEALGFCRTEHVGARPLDSHVMLSIMAACSPPCTRNWPLGMQLCQILNGSASCFVSSFPLAELASCDDVHWLMPSLLPMIFYYIWSFILLKIKYFIMIYYIIKESLNTIYNFIYLN
jgi:hypothetical protein